MNLILLPGNNWRNQAWIEQVHKTVAPDFDQVWVQYYDNWKARTALLNMDLETEELANKARDFGKYCILAKSAGVLLAMKAIKEGKIKPEKCVFVGTAIRWGLEQGWPVDEWVKGYSIPTLFVQRSEDQVMTFGELRHALDKAGATNFRLVELPGRSHHYEDVMGLRFMVKKFIFDSEQVKSKGKKK